MLSEVRKLDLQPLTPYNVVQYESHFQDTNICPCKLARCGVCPAREPDHLRLSVYLVVYCLLRSTAQDIRVASIQHSHRRASEKLSASSSKFDLGAAVSTLYDPPKSDMRLLLWVFQQVETFGKKSSLEN